MSDQPEKCIVCGGDEPCSHSFTMGNIFLGKEIPIDIVQKALDIQRWFEKNGEPEWELMGVKSRCGKNDQPTGIEQSVCADIAARQRKGIQKYGMTVADNPLGHRGWLQHAYEECLDQAIYLKRAIAELDANTEHPIQPPKNETNSHGVWQGCPECGAAEVDCWLPHTRYACGSYDYDQRPGTFKQSSMCKANHEIKSRNERP